MVGGVNHKFLGIVLPCAKKVAGLLLGFEFLSLL